MGEYQRQRSIRGVLAEILHPGFVALQTYWKLFIAIQCAALIFVVTYFLWQPLRDVCAQVATIQQNGGVWFAVVSNVITGVIVPELLKLKFRPKHIPPLKVGEWLHRMLILGWLGFAVYYFYLFQDRVFGVDSAPSVLLKKVLFDQLLFAPFFAVPSIVCLFILHEERYRLRRVLPHLTLSTYRERVLPLWAMGLGYWPIMLLFIYALPGPLQFTLFLFASMAWSLIMLFVASNRWKEA